MIISQNPVGRVSTRLTFKEIQQHVCKRYRVDAITGAETASSLLSGYLTMAPVWHSIKELDTELDRLENL